MVFSSGGRWRSCVQVAALCAFVGSAIPTARAQPSDVGSEVGSVAGESLTSCGISDGDKAFGIQVVTDVSCAAGGLGCYNDHCRYCKIVDTLKSAHLESCETLGVSFPTMAPLTVSAGACAVSSGDAAVGVGGMTDPSCLYGGIGCFNDHCRFCQSELTPQSSQFLLCSWASSTLSSLDGSAGDVGLVPILTADDAGAAESLESGASTSGRKEEAIEAGTASVCAMTASDGNVAVGIGITTDATCASGGVGCIDTICRFCKAKDTTQAAHLNACPVATAANVCGTTVSDGDAAVGISIATDVSCAQGGLGCIDSVCRFCRKTTTAQSSAYVDCASIGSSVVPTAQTPASTTPAPTTAAPVTAVPATTAPAPTTATKQTCSQTVSDGDATVGIKIVTDASCSSGGLGCLDQVCRFCRVTTTIQSASFVDCATIAGSPTTPSPATAAPTSTPAPTTAAPTKTPAPTTTTPTTATPVPTTAAPATKAPSSTAAAVCSISAAAGDVAVGISIVTDNSCAAGGLGCIDTVCRFCKVTTSTRSAAYVDCATISGSTATATQTPTPAPTPTPTPVGSTKAVATPSIVFECSRTVSSGDKGVGLDVVSDVRCSEGGAGCLDDVCRFCKRFDTVQSQTYLNCSSIPSAAVGSDITFVPIPVVDDSEPASTRMLTADSTDASYDADSASSSDASNRTDESFEATAASVCSMTVSTGDASVGINIITDASCANGGLGCIDSVCRYCKTKSTDQSAHFNSCSDYSTSSSATTTTAPATTAAPTTAPVSTASAYSIPLECYQKASSGDKSVGLDIATDIRCGDGGVGCVDTICRFCKRFETTQSHSYMSCSDIPSSDNGADINFKKIVTDDTQQAKEGALEDKPVALQESDEFSSAETDDFCANVSLADGQAAGGIGVVLDTDHCPGGLAPGCIGDAGCRYCMRFPTTVSEYLEYCAIVNGTDVANALSPVIDNGSSHSADAGSAGSLSVGTGSAISRQVNAPSSTVLSMVKSGWLVGAVACVGVIAVIVLAAFGIKQGLTRSSARSSDKEKVTPDDENRPSVLITSNVGEPGIIRDV
ncbi:hypothetical protein PHYPSEUDO_000161 [Phytophthora pseudosyringae]|uniref:Uncharacterized protein n=1 Tax=Phytophthora pseudosyringae TaxID=221518 RepID=A0A8T1WKJ4_9STRA|nr:hypothetical protein PHYPSEUDO_000161 [Phytophthora pseudosyringae]